MLRVATRDSVSGQEKGFQSQSIPPISYRKRKGAISNMFCSLFYYLSTRHGILFTQFLPFATLQMSPNRGSQILEPVKYLSVVTSESKTNKRKGSQSENKRAVLQSSANSPKHKGDSVAGVTPWHTASARRKGSLRKDRALTAIRFVDCNLEAHLPIRLFTWSRLHPFQTGEYNYKVQICPNSSSFRVT